MTISNQQLREAFLSPPMWRYFKKKLSGTPVREVRARVEECLKFLNMATFCRANIPVSREVDDIWHYWILETLDYERLCERLTGRRFIHHRSNDYDEPHNKANQSFSNSIESEVAMLSAYVMNYGPFSPDRIKYWCLADHLVSKRGWSIKQLNNWLKPENGNC